MNRIKFIKFRNEFARSSLLSRNEVSLFAPIIYGYEDKYFNACERYLADGTEEELAFNEFTTTTIKNGMGCSYIESLIILHNIETNPLDACFIYTPRIIE